MLEKKKERVREKYSIWKEVRLCLRKSERKVYCRVKNRNSYTNLIRSLMYLAIATQPDIAYSVNKLAQYTLAPKAKHWTAIKRVFRYLKGTRQHKLTYGGSPGLLHDDINIYCDADRASDSDWKSISGYVIIIAGGAVTWSSKKQNTVAPSTPEAEYTAATHVTKQVLWHHSLLTKLEFPLSSPSIIYSDNQSAIAIAHHPEFHARTKHINIALHFLRDHANKGTIDMFYIKTDYNIADIFTKALTRPVHQNFTYKLGIISVKGSVEVVTGIYWHIPVLYIVVYYCAYIIYCLLTIMK